MRFPHLARRIMLAPALALVLAATVAACSSSSSSTSSAPSSSASATSSTPASPATSPSSSAVAQITANWEKFFNASTPTAQRVALLQNGSAFSSAITTFSKLPLASGIAAKVTGVSVVSATQAAVSYNIVSGSSTLLSGQKGTSVYQGGIWKVGDASLCGLFKLTGGSLPAACNSVG
jgi:hypothetical protein